MSMHSVPHTHTSLLAFFEIAQLDAAFSVPRRLVMVCMHTRAPELEGLRGAPT